MMMTLGMMLMMMVRKSKMRMVFTQGSCVSFNTVEQALDSLKLQETDVNKVRCSFLS